ncbi:putative DNA binding protein [Tripterygium wilfordii]|uniref:Putative DNA binding protein n=1 Tax=Tripterygium wilfordii TaxID=458696 RepID=A0A7J7CNX0_TRIWF|nr:putative DNA binding protein [Tripterygium wilfordii]
MERKKTSISPPLTSEWKFRSQKGFHPKGKTKPMNLLNHKKSLKVQNSSSTTTAKANTTVISTKSSTSSNNSNIGSSVSNNAIYSSPAANGIKQETQISLDDAYRPDLSHCIGEVEAGTSQFNQLCPFPSGFDQLPLVQEGMELHRPVGFSSGTSNLELTEFERLKVERQISASFYAMNGVNEFLENIAYDPSDSFWDLSAFQLFCPT